MKKRNNLKSTRFLTISILFSFVFIALCGKLAYLMIFNGSSYKVLALKQWTRTIEIAPKRGKILDRNGSELAVSMDVYRIDADLNVMLKDLTKKHIPEDQAVEKLSGILDIDKAQMQKIMDSKDSKGDPLQFVSFKRKVEKQKVDAIKALKYRGIIISGDTERVYPNNDFLSHVIGHTNASGNGINGVELSYNKELTGIPGVKVVETDKDNNELPYSESVAVQPVDGKDITLTIDERIQELAERVAQETLQENGAKSVSITIMNPKNGEVLAMVNTPGYDLNNPYKAASNFNETQELWKNRAVSNVFEPGSIFKVITAAAGLQYNKVTDLNADSFLCKGSTTIAHTTLYCDKQEAHGIENFGDIIKNSCNMGFIQLGKLIGKDNLFAFAKQAGFGQKTGIDLPGEGTGIIKDVKTIGPVDYATMSYGQGISVTQIQYLAAFNAVANGGTWIRPHVMKEISHTSDGKTLVDQEYNNFGKRTIMSPDKAAELRPELEKVVESGTSTATYMEGYHIAGKTGTAERIDPATGKYQDGHYVSSFAGMAPTNDPKVTLIVTIDDPNPDKYYAAQTAVPAAKKLFTELFTILNIAPDNAGDAAANLSTNSSDKSKPKSDSSGDNKKSTSSTDATPVKTSSTNKKK